MAGNEFIIRTVRWQEAEAGIRFVRETVFMQEQNVPEDMEWDGLDPECTHVLAFNLDGDVIGTGRITDSGRIGRMSVLREWRNHGIGDLILVALMDLAEKQGFRRITLAAQTHAMGFYERHGFRSTGDIFDDAGIPHQEMALELPSGEDES